MAANQAASLTEDKKIIVIPTKTVPQGITAIINYVPDMDPEDNAATMECEIKNVLTGQVTYAVRDTSVDGKEIKTGDYMGIDDNGIQSVGVDINEVIKELVSSMSDDSSELLSIYYGSDVNEQDAENIKAILEKEYPDYEIDVYNGGQPIYYYIISVE